jgi:hypothetical protein
VFCKYLGLLGMTGNRNFLKRNPIVSLLHAHEDSVILNLFAVCFFLRLQSIVPQLVYRSSTFRLAGG